MESLVSGIKQLNGVLVVVMPDCLLYSAWQRPGQTWDTEVVGAFLGELIRAHLDGLDAIEGWSNMEQVTLELDEALVVVRRMNDPFIAGFVFEKGAAIGWARLQVQRTIKAIEQSLDGGGDAPERVIVAEPPRLEPVKASPVIAVKAAPAQASVSARAASAAAGNAGVVSGGPVSAAPTEPVKAPESVPQPVSRSSGTSPMRSAAPEDTARQAAEAERRKAEQAAPREQVPKGTRLIKYLDAHAPDTHAALLRVSLQTGLPLTLLRMPDTLSEEEFAQVEESVRRILGVEQLNF